MSNDKPRNKGINGTMLKELLGPAPILSTESGERFDQIFDQLIAALEPQDMVEGILVRDFAVPSWEINRNVRYRTLSLERSFKQSLDFQAQRIKSQNARKEDLRKELAQTLAQTPADIARLTQLESKVVGSDKDIDEILSRTPSELDHCHALEKTIDFHKDVEFLITSLTKRRNEALQMLELYRAGLGKRVDETMNKILDAEYRVVDDQPQQVESPSLVPSTIPAASTDRNQPRSTAVPSDPTQETDE